VIIRLNDVPPEGRVFSGEAPASVIDLAEEDLQVVGPVSYRLKAVRMPGTLFVSGEMDVTVEFRCCRCYERFTQQVSEAEYTSTWELSAEAHTPPRRIEGSGELSGGRRGKKRKRGEARDPVEDLDEAQQDPESVDLTGDIRESMILAFPHYPACRPECKGLCPTCGINLNRDTCSCRPPGDDRWSRLDELNVMEGH